VILAEAGKEEFVDWYENSKKTYLLQNRLSGRYHKRE
jgi:hypothetical protein